MCDIKLFILLCFLFILYGCDKPDSKKEDSQIKSGEIITQIEADVFEEMIMPLVFSESSNKPVHKTERYQPMIDDLISSIDSQYFDSGLIRIHPEIEPIIEDIKANRIHLVMDGTYIVLRIARETENDRFLINAKDGDPLFQSYFVVLKDSKINTLDDLIGKKLALEDSESTSGYFCPMVTLYSHSLKLDKTEPYDEDTIALYLAGEDELILRDVLNGKADCGVIPDYDFDELNASVRENLKIISKSELMPRNLLMISKDIPNLESEKIIEYFLNLSDIQDKEVILTKLSSSGFLKINESFSEKTLKDLIIATEKIAW